MTVPRDGGDARRARERRESPRRALAWASAVFLAAVLVMFGDVLLAGGARVLSAPDDDVGRFFLHWYRFGFDELRKGHLVLWNPHVFSGSPFFGSFQPALLYPPNWIYLVLPLEIGIDVNIAAHFFMAGLWTYLWATHRGLRPAASVFAGLVFMFCGPHFLQVYRGHLPNLCTLIWTPLILLAVDGVLQTRGLRWVLLGMAAVAMQILAGHVQYFFYTTIIVALYALAGWVRAAHRWRTAGALVSIYAGAAFLVAIQLFTGVQAVSESLRTGLRWVDARSYAFPPENVLTLVLPGILGDMISTPYWGRWTLTENSLFVGTAAFVCAVYGVARGARAAKGPALAMAIVALILACGSYTPLFRLLYDFVPGFGSFRGIYKFTYLTGLFLALLAGVGLDRVLAGDTRRWPAIMAAMTALLLFVAGIAVAVSSRAEAAGWWGRLLLWFDAFPGGFLYRTEPLAGMLGRAGTQASHALWIGAASFAVVAGLWLAAGRSARWAHAIALFGCLELMVHARRYRPTFDPAPIRQEAELLERFVRQTGSEHRILTRSPYVGMTAGAFDVWGLDPMVLRRYARFIAFTQGKQEPDLAVWLRRLPPLFGLLRLRYTVELGDGELHGEPTNFAELPRALLIPHWRVLAEPEAILRTMASPDFAARRVVVLESDPGLPVETQSARDAFDDPGTVRVVDRSTDVLEIWAEAPRPSILVVTDSYSSGWTVTPLDDAGQRDYRVLPADYVVRGIPLDRGRHHFLLAYRPRAFVVGTWVTLVSLVGYAGLVIVVVRRRRRGGGDADGRQQ